MVTFKELKNDLPAGIVVFLVAVPLCLGIAMASGAPLFSGIIAGFVGGIVVTLISGSQLGVSGPAAGLAVIVLHAIEGLGSFEVFLSAVVLAGVMQLALGFLKAGSIGYYFPSSVIKGMLSGIGVIIILKQIPHAFGYDESYEGSVHFMEPSGETTFSLILDSLRYVSPAAVIISVLSLLVLIFWDTVLSKKGKIFQIVQGPLVVVVLGIVLNLVFLNMFPEMALRANHLVELPVASSVGGFFQQFTAPDFSRILTYEVLMLAGTLAVVASLETLLCLEATDKLDPQKRISPANRELKAQGVGNIVSGLIGGLPITQVIVRSSANIQSGGRTKLSALIHGVLILASVIAIPGLLNLIPLASLAAILFVVGYKLAKPALFKAMYRGGWNQFLPFVVTVLAIVFTDLLTGIAIGMVVGIFFILKSSYQVSHKLQTEKTTTGKEKYRIVLAEEVTFLNKGNIMEALRKVPKNTELEIDMSRSAVVDPDVLELIENYKDTAQSKGIDLHIKKTAEDEKLQYEGAKF
ncbi:SulP family inorganic anion transporter [Pontibacter ramchanderi]|uniref:MFS superfamily sulfate permease-like transporter n=1 Tax=Pontibacter ramchanderi TaxID=1179743 RepID=A0A2N3V2D5_9BACT|nr:SulP family inorganic anion transporter [Pontibacter ramchanderi]PKV75792.1 MFS superfamily sulfate permease-like transporter [Pontibacter ramchanderi]